ncbi:MAG: hypothetical protein JW800_02230 [Candidatus Omnitrophica bacterium]|nr:hypothetical protein [Candidatus Omnitrophota bacterium]
MLFSKDMNDKHLALLKAMEDIETFFVIQKEGQLYKFLLDIIEKPLIENVLTKTNGNQIKAARILGINRNTLHSKIKRLDIDLRKFKNG